jgi:hypothetical protein
MSTPETRSKGVHVKLDKETHLAFKIKLLHHSVSMQEAFEEFARQVGMGSVSANNIIVRMIRHKIKLELASVGLKPSRRKPRYVSELSDDGLYDLINEGDGNADEPKVPTPGGGRHEAA